MLSKENHEECEGRSTVPLPFPILSFNKETPLINKGLLHVHLNNTQVHRLSLLISYCVNPPRHSHAYLGKERQFSTRFKFFFLNPKVTLGVGSWVVSVVTLITITVLQKHYVI